MSETMPEHTTMSETMPEHTTMSETMPEHTTTSDKEKKKKSSKKSKKKKRNPHKSRGLAYKMRVADDGTIWHSEVDIDRPNSPIVEFPEYPGFEIRDPMPSFSLNNIELIKKFGETGDIRYAEAAERENQRYIQEVEDPDKEEDNEEDYDGVYQQQYPGMYDGNTMGDATDNWDV